MGVNLGEAQSKKDWAGMLFSDTQEQNEKLTLYKGVKGGVVSAWIMFLEVVGKGPRDLCMLVKYRDIPTSMKYIL